MEDRTLHPSMKTVWAAYGLAIVVILAGIWAYFQYEPDWPAWVPAILLILLLPPIRMHLRRRLVTLRLHDDHLTIETGFLSRTRRTVDMAKIQDVTVSQTLGQRMLGVGNLMLESAGESGRIAIGNLDSPRAIADVIIASSKRTHGGGAPGGL
jgi:membrane protein YdbS with pleckstrin-like domain